jgi:hypothetical protein
MKITGKITDFNGLPLGKTTIKKINSQIDKLLTSKASIVDNETDNSKSNSNDQVI